MTTVFSHSEGAGGVKCRDSLEGLQTLLRNVAVERIASEVDPRTDELSVEGYAELSQEQIWIGK